MESGGAVCSDGWLTDRLDKMSRGGWKLSVNFGTPRKARKARLLMNHADLVAGSSLSKTFLLEHLHANTAALRRDGSTNCTPIFFSFLYVQSRDEGTVDS